MKVQMAENKVDRIKSRETGASLKVRKSPKLSKKPSSQPFLMHSRSYNQSGVSLNPLSTEAAYVLKKEMDKEETSNPVFAAGMTPSQWKSINDYQIVGQSHRKKENYNIAIDHYFNLRSMYKKINAIKFKKANETSDKPWRGTMTDNGASQNPRLREPSLKKSLGDETDKPLKKKKRKVRKVNQEVINVHNELKHEMIDNDKREQRQLKKKIRPVREEAAGPENKKIKRNKKRERGLEKTSSSAPVDKLKKTKKKAKQVFPAEKSTLNKAALKKTPDDDNFYENEKIEEENSSISVSSSAAHVVQSTPVIMNSNSNEVRESSQRSSNKAVVLEEEEDEGDDAEDSQIHDEDELDEEAEILNKIPALKDLSESNVAEFKDSLIELIFSYEIYSKEEFENLFEAVCLKNEKFDSELLGQIFEQVKEFLYEQLQEVDNEQDDSNADSKDDSLND